MPGNPFIPADKLSLSQKEKDAIEYYTGGESLWMNNLLRDVRVDEITNRKYIEGMVDALTFAIRKSPPSINSTTVYRGASPIDKSWENLKVGDELLFTSKGFVSTSFSKETAKGFLDGRSCCLLVLHLPKGTRGLYVGASSLFTDFDEDELILPHGSRFIVNTYRMEDGVKVYDATLTHQLGFPKGVKDKAKMDFRLTTEVESIGPHHSILLSQRTRGSYTKVATLEESKEGSLKVRSVSLPPNDPLDRTIEAARQRMMERHGPLPPTRLQMVWHGIFRFANEKGKAVTIDVPALTIPGSTRLAPETQAKVDFLQSMGLKPIGMRGGNFTLVKEEHNFSPFHSKGV